MNSDQLLTLLQETHHLHPAVDPVHGPKKPDPAKWQKGLRFNFSEASMNSVLIGQLCDISRQRAVKGEIRALAGAVLAEIFAEGVGHKDAANILESAHVLRHHNIKGLKAIGERMMQTLGVGTR